MTTGEIIFFTCALTVVAMGIPMAVLFVNNKRLKRKINRMHHELVELRFNQKESKNDRSN